MSQIGEEQTDRQADLAVHPEFCPGWGLMRIPFSGHCAHAHTHTHTHTVIHTSRHTHT